MKLLKLAILLTISTVFLIFGSSAWSDPPDHAKGKPTLKFNWVDELGDPFQLTEDFIDCGEFETEITLVFSGFWITHYDKDGNPTWEFYHSAWPAKIVNRDDDSYFVVGIPGQVMNRHWLGEPFNSDSMETGVQLMITLPGYGVIFRNVGRVLLDNSFWPPIPLHFTRHWDSFDEDYQALCEALKPAT